MPRYRATNCVLPCVPHPHALGMPRGVLTTRQYNARLAVGGGSALAALPPSTVVAAMGGGNRSLICTRVERELDLFS